MNIRLAQNTDIKLLAILNQQLIADGGHQNPESLDELQKRLEKLMNTGDKAYIFESNDQVVGYAMVKTERTPLLLTQFLILKPYRRVGYGRLAFHRLIEGLGTRTIDIEAFGLSEQAIAFWKSLGFIHRMVWMRFSRSEDSDDSQVGLFEDLSGN